MPPARQQEVIGDIVTNAWFKKYVLLCVIITISAILPACSHRVSRYELAISGSCELRDDETLELFMIEITNGTYGGMFKGAYPGLLHPTLGEPVLFELKYAEYECHLVVMNDRTGESVRMWKFELDVSSAVPVVTNLSATGCHELKMSLTHLVGDGREEQVVVQVAHESQ